MQIRERLANLRPRFRPPAVPYPPSVLIAYGGVVAYAAHNLLYMPGVQPQHVLFWSAWTALFSGLAMGAIPLLAAMERRGAFARADLGAWARFILVLALSAFLAAVARSAAAMLTGTVPLPADRFWPFALNLAVSLLFVSLCLELTAARARTFRDGAAEAERLIRELQQSQRALITHDDRLRQETAEFLHGEMQTRFLVAWVQLDEAFSLADRDPKAAARLIASAEEHLDDLRTRSRLQAEDLLDVSSEGEDLVAAVKALVRRFEIVMPIQLELSPEAGAHARLVSPEARRVGLCVLEEALLNACRHARATHVRVSLAVAAAAPLEGERLEIAIHDDGIGFDPARQDLGLGLSGLAQALRSLGASFQIASAPGGGTHVRLGLPGAAPCEGERR